MINDLVESSIQKLVRHCEAERYKGYDPYDILNSNFPFSKIHNKIPAIAIQLHKRNPINLRPLFGIKKDYNPKALGLFLKAYSFLYRLYKEDGYLKKCKEISDLLINFRSKEYSRYCWGYNFDWASPGNYIKAYTPSVLVTGFVVDGFYEFYKLTHQQKIKDIIISAAEFIDNDLPKLQYKMGICIKYTAQSSGCCYNAALVGAETLIKAYDISGASKYLEAADSVVNFVISRQKRNGCWNYSVNEGLTKEREQIDFHQGFVLMSLLNYMKIKGESEKLLTSIKNGAEFYFYEQFFNNGRSKWRLPKIWPIDIHHQAQGIITFANLKFFSKKYFNFSKKIAEWTINNLQDKEGYFHYRKYRFFTDRTTYIRWGQAWMLLALASLLEAENNG